MENLNAFTFLQERISLLHFLRNETIIIILMRLLGQGKDSDHVIFFILITMLQQMSELIPRGQGGFLGRKLF